jgi:cyclohexanone monooxygenase
MTADASARQTTPDPDVIVVGAGFAGLNALHHFRAHGLRVRVLEAGSGVGGTWYWNRYPGARVDIESLEYSYAFSEEIQQEWHWPERYSEQPDVLRYLEWIADRLDLRRDIQFDTHVTSAVFDGDAMLWTITTESGDRLRARYCVMAVGFLSATHWPDIPGFESFEGDLVHTGAWPRDGLPLMGRRVGVIGVGATGVQLVPRIAPQVGHLTVFQREPNWCFPMNNMPMPDEYESYVKSMYPEIRQQEYSNRGPGVVLVGFNVKTPSDTKVFDVSDEEREREFEARWADCGLHVAGSFSDLMTDENANATLQEFMERKIRSIVTNPDVADLLIPKNHPPFTRRPPGESGYYEAFNRPNVTLVDVLSDTIAEITPTGLRLESGREFAVDVLISATGFDAGTGGLTRIDITGRGGVSLKDYWASGARTHLGMMSHGFPNIFFLNAVQSPSAFFSPPLLGDYQIRYIGRIIDELAASGAVTVEPSAEAEAAWVEHVNDVVNATLLPKANSWWMGANIPGKPRQVVAYAGGFPEYQRQAEIGFDNGLQAFIKSG